MAMNEVFPMQSCWYVVLACVLVFLCLMHHLNNVMTENTRARSLVTYQRRHRFIEEPTGDIGRFFEYNHVPTRALSHHVRIFR